MTAAGTVAPALATGRGSGLVPAGHVRGEHREKIKPRAKGRGACPQVRVETGGGVIDEARVNRQHRPHRVGVIRAAIGVGVVAGAVPVGEIVIKDDSAAVRVVGVDPKKGVFVKDVVFDVHPAQRHPQDDAFGAVIRHHVVVHLHAGHGGVAGDLQTAAGIANGHVVEDDLVVAAQIQPVVEIAARTPVVVNVVGHVRIIGVALVGIDAVPAVCAGAGGVAVGVDFVVADLVGTAPDADP